MVITVVALYMLQNLLCPKYQKGIVEGAMIAEYYDSEEYSSATAKYTRIFPLWLCTATTESLLT